MTSNLNDISNQFTEFLTEYKNVIGKPEFFEDLISYKIPAIDFHTENKLSTFIENYPRFFYIENALQNFSLMGLGTALEMSSNGLGRFSAISKSVRELQSKLISNWKDEQNNFPLICGGMKFTAEHSEAEWQDFKDSDWFVPEFLLVKKSGSQNLFYNFVNQTSSIKKHADKFSQRLEVLLSMQNKMVNKSSKILSAKGLSPKDKKKWKALVTDTLDKLAENQISKIVLSRRVDMVLSTDPGWDEVRKYFADNYSGCTTFIYHNNNSAFFGASPERLIKFHDKKVTIDILAGSISRGKTEDEDKALEREMMSSSKLNHEHDLVVHQVKKAISKYVSKIYSDKIPLKKLHNIQHLHTVMHSELVEDTNMFEIIEAIYPTGAICGEPRDKALSLIKKIEDYKRGLYSGLIGYFNLNDEGEFVVGIRSALLHENKLFAYAGCGIVEGSDPEKEFQETELKLKVILSFFNEKNKR
jgi:menaquinone-specific isochorismate synthase